MVFAVLEWLSRDKEQREKRHARDKKKKKILCVFVRAETRKTTGVLKIYSFQANRIELEVDW